MIWLNENCTLSDASNFNELKEKILTQSEVLSKSNRTVYAFLREKSNVFFDEQQLKWCESLQTSSNSTNRRKIYENNYISTIESKLRSFQIRLNLRFVVTNVQLAQWFLNFFVCFTLLTKMIIRFTPNI